MKNNIIDIILFGLVIIIFAGYFIAIDLTFKNNVTEQLKLAESYARSEDWYEVLRVSKDLKKTWSRKKYLIMFNFATSEISTLENHINYIIGGAEGKQLDTTLGNILAVQDLWKNVKRIVPEP